MDTENRIDLGLWNERLVCYVRAWVPIDESAWLVVLNPSNAPNMSGCIEFAEKINSKAILVYSKNKPNFLYLKKNGAWVCINKDWKNNIDIDMYNQIQKIGD